jgi:hypothetical protein
VPALRLGIFASTNTEGGAALSDALPARVIDRFYAPPREPPADSPKIDVAVARRVFAGNYLSTRRRYSGLEGFVMRVQAVVSIGVTPEGYLLASGVGGSPQRFVQGPGPDDFVNANGPNAPLGRIHFERDGGRAVRIAIVPIALERTTGLYDRSTLMLCAGLALLSALGIAIGGFLRLASRPAASAGQRLAGRVQLACAWLWLASVAGFAAFAARAADTVNVVYHWPGAPMLVASSAALAASVLTLASALFLPAVWRGALDGARSAAGWSAWRKTRYTLALLLFAAFAVVLGAWGALEPWQP